MATRVNYPRVPQVVTNAVEPDDAAMHLFFHLPSSLASHVARLSRPENRAKWYFRKMIRRVRKRKMTEGKEKCVKRGRAKSYGGERKL